MKDCQKDCNKKYPSQLIYRNGKLVDKIWYGKKGSKKKKPSKKKSKSKNLIV